MNTSITATAAVDPHQQNLGLQGEMLLSAAAVNNKPEKRAKCCEDGVEKCPPCFDSSDIEVPIYICLALLLWAATVLLFFKRWKKLRVLEPYQPQFYEAQHDPVCPMVNQVGFGACASETGATLGQVKVVSSNCSLNQNWDSASRWTPGPSAFQTLPSLSSEGSPELESDDAEGDNKPSNAVCVQVEPSSPLDPSTEEPSFDCGPSGKMSACPSIKGSNNNKKSLAAVVDEVVLYPKHSRSTSIYRLNVNRPNPPCCRRETVQSPRIIALENQGRLRTGSRVSLMNHPLMMRRQRCTSTVSQSSGGFSTPGRRSSVQYAPLLSKLLLQQQQGQFQQEFPAEENCRKLGTYCGVTAAGEGNFEDIELEMSSPTMVAASSSDDCDHTDLIRTHDLTKIDKLGDAEEELKKRFFAGEIYTWVGPALLAINPLGLGENFFPPRYSKDCSKNPHVRVIADKAWDQLCSSGSNQILVVSGESGSGKTVSGNLILERLLSKFQSSLVKSLRSIEPLLEAFGNAKTQHNDNSSRFGKLVSLDCSKRDRSLIGATLSTFMLEKTRVSSKPFHSERNFHIFYQLVLGLDEDVKKSLGLFSRTWCILGRSEHSQLAADLLGLTHSELMSALSSEKMFVGGRVVKSNAKSVSRRTMVERTVDSGEQREARRDTLMRLLYESVFLWLRNTFNRGLERAEDVDKIGILDVYGFECFQENSLEQLCINYANERIQQCYVTSFLKSWKEELFLELGVSDSIQTHVDLVDNSPIVAELDGKLSLFGLINEECRLKSSLGDESIVKRLEPASLKKILVSRTNRNLKSSFVIKHYARQVDYSVTGMIAKNKDCVPVEFADLLSSSTSDFIVNKLGKIWGSACEAERFEVSAYKKSRKLTILTKFKNSLDDLMKLLKTSELHFVRCVKPSVANSVQLWNPETISRQLSALGITATLELARAGLPNRFSFPVFLAKYSFLASEDLRLSLKTVLGEEDSHNLQLLMSKFLSEIFMESGFKVGISRVFLSDEAVEVLEKLVAVRRKAAERVIRRGLLNWKQKRCLAQAEVHDVKEEVVGRSVFGALLSRTKELWSRLFSAEEASEDLVYPLECDWSQFYTDTSVPMSTEKIINGKRVECPVFASPGILSIRRPQGEERSFRAVGTKLHIAHAIPWYARPKGLLDCLETR
ncbi:unnamed protein product [Notodromas monacha]|uniref:Myosin motor domain-containing protein n=1 Tax=Notodromas monacha TaxID=399045 RepID=A0A7R9GHP2_9CRUS|nr:unnamed protein product [Notodromas monacha]CAG0921003.1 unnamed protein product [Notodromas monacha]